MIKVALVGVNNIAKSHISVYLKMSAECEIVALCDIFPENAQKINEEFNLNCQIFSDYKDMLEGIEFDLIDICTPPLYHCEIAVSAMDHGINVVCEKPFATSVEECDKMIDAQKRNNVILSSIAQNRFTNDMNKLKIMSGKLGKIRVANVNSFWSRSDDYYKLWWRGRWEKEGGGCTFTLAVHHLDLLTWIKGKMPSEITAVIANVGHKNSEVEDVSCATAMYDDGTIAQITTSICHHGQEQNMIFQCEDGKISAPWDAKVSGHFPTGFHFLDEEKTAKINEMHNNIEDLQDEKFDMQLKNVLQCIKTGETPLVTAQDGKNTIEFIAAIYKSAFLKRTVSLPIEKDDEFYKFQGILDNMPRFNIKED